MADPVYPDPEPPVDIDQIIEDVVGVSIGEYRDRHPALYRALRARLSNPVSYVIETLQADAAFRALMEKTEQEIDKGEIVKMVITTGLKLMNAYLGCPLR